MAPVLSFFALIKRLTLQPLCRSVLYRWQHGRITKPQGRKPIIQLWSKIARQAGQGLLTLMLCNAYCVYNKLKYTEGSTLLPSAYINSGAHPAYGEGVGTSLCYDLLWCWLKRQDYHCKPSLWKPKRQSGYLPVCRIQA
jgi:hypothetical protein